jgi:hypothetical protein
MNLNLNTFLLVSAIVALIFGLGFVLLPGIMFSITGSHRRRHLSSVSDCSARR